jgi:FkbM family methyltransferase
MLTTIRSAIADGLKWRIERAIGRALPLYAITREEPLVAFLRPFIGRGSLVDIGANTGAFTNTLGRKMPAIAFEPIPELCEELAGNNPLAVVHNCALSDAEGALTLYIPYRNGRPILSRCSLNADANLGFEVREKTVPVKRLDDFALKNVSIIKIDVEGHERATLVGAEQTIRRCRPALLVEIEERHHPGQSVQIIEWIAALGYSAHFFHEGLRSFSEFDFAALQNVRNLREPGQPAKGPYINNFLFLPA